MTAVKAATKADVRMDYFKPDQEVYGLLKPNIDAHTLGITHIAQLLKDCGVTAIIGDESVSKILTQHENQQAKSDLYDWVRSNRVSRLGFSYRLDPAEGCEAFGWLFHFLKSANLLSVDGGPVKAVYFAGLPSACEAIQRNFGNKVTVFNGDETPVESLLKLGLPRTLIPDFLMQSSEYDDFRMHLGKALIHKEAHRSICPSTRPTYSGYGTFQDRLLTRLNRAKRSHQLPLFRAHVGPYRSDRSEAVQLFKSWLHGLARAGFLDIASIGTSQLTQERFGEDWSGLPNGGGVPINTPQEYRDAWDASRPMLLRTYAGTKNIVSRAKMYEAPRKIAWHALSLWWFCKIDGRGPNTLFQNLCEHLDTLSFVARSDKPFEPNVPHHFAFRGADDVSCILSAFLAAQAAKLRGVRYLILQIMLNTPSQTWGIQDIAKARAMLHLVRTLEDKNFSIIMQPRAGLDFFSSDTTTAMAQLAAVTMLMDDIEPHDRNSPPIIHVVSYTEGNRLADPDIINESIQITKAALNNYRTYKQKGETPDLMKNEDLMKRTNHLVKEAYDVLNIIQERVPRPYSAEGLYKIFAAGFLPVPYLWGGKNEFDNAINWRTRFFNGGVVVVDDDSKPISAKERAEKASNNLLNIRLPLLLPLQEVMGLI